MECYTPDASHPWLPACPQGPHMESVSRLLTAAELLEAAEQAYRLPSVAHAEVQVRPRQQ